MKIKKWLQAFLLCLLVLTVLPAAASAAELKASGVGKDGLSWSVTDDGVLTISGSGAMSSLSSERNYPWYPYRGEITSIIVESGVTELGNSAFKGYKALTSVNLSDGIKVIRARTFQDCTALEGIELPGQLETLGDYAFTGSSALKKIHIPAGVTTMGYRLFYNCTGLTEVVLSDGIGMGDEMFRDCHLLSDVTLPADLEYLPVGAFYRCFSLGEIFIPKSVTFIDNYVFNQTALELAHYGGSEEEWAAIIIGNYNYELFNSALTYDGVTSLGGSLGNGLSWTLKGAGVLTISGEGAMPDYESENDTPWAAYHSYNIRQVVIEPGITHVGAYCFKGCYDLSYFSIPDSAVSIGASAFANCYLEGELIVRSGRILGANAYAGNDFHKITVQDNVTIGEAAFSGIRELKELTIGDNVNIGSRAFQFVYKLQTVTIGDNVVIGSNAFYDSGGYSYWSVTIGKNADIGSHAFYLSYVRSAAIGGGTIGAHAFDCTPLKELTLCEGVTSIGAYGFYNCHSLEDVVIPASCTYIGEYAFAKCTGLSNVFVGIGTLGEGVFSGCSKLGKAELGDEVTEIGKEAFKDCTSLEEVKIPDGVKEIGEGAFENCTGLNKVTLGSNCEKIGDKAFNNCENLEEVNLCDKVNKIGGSAFGNCCKLNTVTFPGTREQWESIEKGENNEYLDKSDPVPDATPGPKPDAVVTAQGTCGENLTWVLYDDKTLVISGQGPMENYLQYQRPGWYEYRSHIRKVVIESGVTTVGDYAFDNCTVISLFFLPDTLVSIGSAAFQFCSAFFEVELPTGLLSIGDYAFSYSGLKSIAIPDSVTSIDDYAFHDCSALTSATIGTGLTELSTGCFSWSSLTSIVIPDNIKTINDSAFDFCTDLETLTISEGVEVIETCAFLSCMRLREVTIPDSVQRIEKSAFAGCSCLESVTIGKGLTYLGEANFSGWSLIKSFTVHEENPSYSNDDRGALFDKEKTVLIQYPPNVGHSSYTLPASVVTICDEAFISCDHLQEITLNPGLVTIGSGAFQGCCYLKRISIPDSVTSIGERAFRGCWRAAELSLGAGLTAIPKEAFSGCESLSEVRIPDGVTTIGQQAFANCNALKEITFPGSVTFIGDEAFSPCESLVDVYFAGNAPTVSAADSKGSFAVDTATLHYIEGTENWEVHFNPVDGKWNGYTLTSWGRFFGESHDLLAHAQVTEKDKIVTFSVTLAEGTDDMVVYIAFYNSENRMTILKAATVCADSAERSLEYIVPSRSAQAAAIFFTRPGGTLAPLDRAVRAPLPIITESAASA